MHTKRSIWQGLVMAGLVGFVAGCAAPWADAKPTSCPRLSVLADAATLTKYKPGKGRDVLDVVYESAYTGAKLECDYDIDGDTKAGSVSVELTLAFEVARGPAGAGPKVDLSYFVAVLDRDDRVMNKQVFSLPVEYDGNATRAAATDRPVFLDIPLKANQTGVDFRIYTGFQLSRDELTNVRAQP